MVLWKWQVQTLDIYLTFGLNIGFGFMYVPGREQIGIIIGPFAIGARWNDLDDWGYDDLE